MELTCRGCGACCLHVVRPPFYVLKDPAWIWLCFTRPDLVAEFEADRETRDAADDAPCLWLDSETYLCRHYELRPEICQDFEPGEPDCFAARERTGRNR